MSILDVHGFITDRLWYEVGEELRGRKDEK